MSGGDPSCTDAHPAVVVDRLESVARVTLARPEKANAMDGEITDALLAAVVALREIEFDRATGKLSDADYNDLKSRYTREAVAAMRREAAGPRPSDDELEAAVRAYREQHGKCPTCGPRPEPDAIYCSNCGRST